MSKETLTMPDKEVKPLAHFALETDANAEMTIGEVAHVTGYTTETLRRLDGVKIPASRRSKKHNNARVWLAKDVVKIIAYKGKMADKSQERMKTLYLKRGKKSTGKK